MAEKAKNNKNQGLILGLCIAIIIIAVIVAAIIAIMISRRNGLTGLNDSYFTTDGSKYVIEMDGDDLYVEDEISIPNKYYLVYNYSGDNITGLKAYYQYNEIDTAQKVYQYFLDNYSSLYDSIDIDGTYIILTIPASDYEGITASDVKTQIELIEATKDTQINNDLETPEGETTENETIEESLPE